MGRPSKWSPEFREEAVRMYRESDESIAAVARRLGLGPETFRRWVREDEVERGQRPSELLPARPPQAPAWCSGSWS
jgi:transposase